MADSITVKWDSGQTRNFAASTAALNTYDPPPDISGKIAIKGEMTLKALDDIVHRAEKHGLEVELTLVGKWADEEERAQLRLFPVDGRDPLEGIVDEAKKLKQSGVVIQAGDGSGVEVKAGDLAEVGS